MNIFITSPSPKVSARNLCDTHVVSQLKETAQILSNCFTLEQMAQEGCPRTQKGTPRKHSYPHHRCCKWAKQTRSNMEWLLDHGIKICSEFIYRKDKSHFSADFIYWCRDNIKDSIVPEGPLTPFIAAINQEQRCRNEVPNFDNLPVDKQYQEYYCYDKARFAKWTKRPAPNWFQVK